jgi:hypothetical protein
VAGPDSRAPCCALRSSPRGLCGWVRKPGLTCPSRLAANQHRPNEALDHLQKRTSTAPPARGVVRVGRLPWVSRLRAVGAGSSSVTTSHWCCSSRAKHAQPRWRPSRRSATRRVSTSIASVTPSPRAEAALTADRATVRSKPKSEKGHLRFKGLAPQARLGNMAPRRSSARLGSLHRAGNADGRGTQWST